MWEPPHRNQRHTFEEILMRRVFILALVAAGLTACGSAEEPLAQPETTTTTTAAAQGGATSTTEVLTLQTAPQSEAALLLLARAARADLAATLGVPEDEISVTGASAVTWNDGSMGCPQPDMSYTQALVDGGEGDFEPWRHHLHLSPRWW